MIQNFWYEQENPLNPAAVEILEINDAIFALEDSVAIIILN